MLASVCTRDVSPNKTLHVWVYEEAPEVLARHMLLLSILLDTSLPVRQRTELFIELHSNACIQVTTAEYLGKLLQRQHWACTFPLHVTKREKKLTSVNISCREAGPDAGNSDLRHLCWQTQCC